METRFIQVGVTALRDPATGGFLPAVPLYIEATPEAQQAEEALTVDIAKLFAQRMRQYTKTLNKTNKANKAKEKKHEQAGAVLHTQGAAQGEQLRQRDQDPPGDL